MTRPLRLMAYRIGREFGIDVDVVMRWPLAKLYEHMAFFVTETPEFQERYKEQTMTEEQRMRQIMNFIGSGL